MELTPIAHKGWVLENAGKYIRRLYGWDHRLRLINLPEFNIMPEHISKIVIYDVELMLAMIQAGAWLNGQDWHTYARYTIARRLKVRADLIFQSPFHEIKDSVMEYQLHGGNFKQREDINKFASRVALHPKSNRRIRATSKLLLSITDEVLPNTYYQPFHWIRVAFGSTESSSIFAMSLINGEMQRQKQTLCKMLTADID